LFDLRETIVLTQGKVNRDVAHILVLNNYFDVLTNIFNFYLPMLINELIITTNPQRMYKENADGF